MVTFRCQNCGGSLSFQLAHKPRPASSEQLKQLFEEKTTLSETFYNGGLKRFLEISCPLCGRPKLESEAYEFIQNKCLPFLRAYMELRNGD